MDGIMDKNYVKTVIEGLKSSSSSRVQESLLKIRSKVITNDNGIKLFADCGGLNYLVSYLRKPNEKILGLALSILGNCCLNDECRQEVGKLHIIPPLISMLKTVSRDSIVGRACRVVGNIAQKNSYVEDLHNHGAVPALVTLIQSRDKNTSYPTLTMAVRAVRQLWTAKSKREEMLNGNSVRCIAILLTTECESAGILKSDDPQNEVPELRKSQEELITGILKCLGYFTTHATVQCAEQIQGDGRGYQCLVALTKIFESLALRCLMNLCFLSDARPLLGNAGLVPCLVAILQKTSEVSWWPEGMARMLVQLCGESVNRARLRHSGGLPLLLAAAREHSFAMRALLQYVFDNISFQILINEGLIGFMVEELKKHLITMDYEHSYKEPTNEYNDKVTSKHSEENVQHEEKLDKGKTGLFKRRIQSNDEDELNVVIERDNMLVGFKDTVDSDASDSHNEDETPQKRSERLKRSRSISPDSFMKRCRVWGADVYWEMKSERNGPNTSKNRDAAPMSPCSDSASGFSPEYRGGKRSRCDWSPESGFSTGEGSAASPYWNEYQWSPSSSSGPTSPLSAVNEDSSDSEISGRYSPVCSDHEHEPEAAADVTSVTLDAAQAALDELAMHDMLPQDDDDILEEKDTEPYFDMESSRIGCVLVLLYRAANGPYDQHGQPKESVLPNSVLEQLTSKEYLNTLLDYMERCRKPFGRVARILTLIFGNALCFTNILKHKTLLRLHNLSSSTVHPMSKCRQCRLVKKLCVKLMSRLTAIADASYGTGEISYQLLRGPDCMKETLSFTLPYIVKSKQLLTKYYIGLKALTILFNGLPEINEEFQYYVTALAKLSNLARIKDPKLLENRFSEHVVVTYDPVLDGLLKEEIVTFELDDMSTVIANKTFLCQNSEVFSAMLMGCFKESIEESVKIKNVTKEGLEYLLTLLHCGLDNSKCDLKVFPMADKLETNLEVLLLADRFLFENLKVLLNSAILQFKMTPGTADKIYAWSLSDGMGFLCVESVAYLLTGKMCETDRSRAFRNILNLEYKEQWLEDIKSIIIRHLEDWRC